jgi:hypothetical protein
MLMPRSIRFGRTTIVRSPIRSSVAYGKAHREVSDNNAKLEYRGCTRLSQGVQRREVIEIKGRAPLDNRADRAHRHVIIGHNT